MRNLSEILLSVLNFSNDAVFHFRIEHNSFHCTESVFQNWFHEWLREDFQMKLTIVTNIVQLWLRWLLDCCTKKFVENFVCAGVSIHMWIMAQFVRVVLTFQWSFMCLWNIFTRYEPCYNTYFGTMYWLLSHILVCRVWKLSFRQWE